MIHIYYIYIVVGLVNYRSFVHFSNSFSDPSSTNVLLNEMNKFDKILSYTITNDFPSDEHGQLPEYTSVEANSDSPLNGLCQMCGKNLQHLNPQRQAQHINRCMDQV